MYVKIHRTSEHLLPITDWNADVENGTVWHAAVRYPLKLHFLVAKLLKTIILNCPTVVRLKVFGLIFLIIFSLLFILFPQITLQIESKTCICVLFLVLFKQLLCTPFCSDVCCIFLSRSSIKKTKKLDLSEKLNAASCELEMTK